MNHAAVRNILRGKEGSPVAVAIRGEDGASSGVMFSFTVTDTQVRLSLGDEDAEKPSFHLYVDPADILSLVVFEPE